MIFVLGIIGVILLLVGKIPLGQGRYINRSRTSKIGLLLILPIPLDLVTGFLVALLGSGWNFSARELLTASLLTSSIVDLAATALASRMVLTTSEKDIVDQRLPLLNRETVPLYEAAHALRTTSAEVSRLVAEGKLEMVGPNEVLTRPVVILASQRRAIEYLKRLELDKALAVLTQGLEIDPQNAGFHALISKVYQDKGNQKEADRYRRTAIQIDPAYNVSNIDWSAIAPAYQLSREHNFFQLLAGALPLLIAVPWIILAWLLQGTVIVTTPDTMEVARASATAYFSNSATQYFDRETSDAQNLTQVARATASLMAVEASVNGTARALNLRTLPGKFVFEAKPLSDSTRHVYLLDANANNPHQALPQKFPDPYTHVSPDGKRIVLVGAENGSIHCSRSVLVKNIDGSDPHPIPAPDCIIPYSLTWSPDSTRLAYALSDDSGLKSVIDVFDVTKNTAQQMTQDGVGGMPVWSPDGNYIAFFYHLGNKSNFSILVLDLQHNLCCGVIDVSADMPVLKDTLNWVP